jgi:TolB protein
MDPIHQELLRQAVEAAKNNDIDTAIIKVKEVLEEDEENAKAWLLLARLTSNNDEKRIALASLLQLEPDNEKAKELLAKLETQVKTRDEEEVLPGVSRRLVRFIVGGLVVFVILMIGLIAIIGQNRSAADAQATKVALNDLATAQEFNAQQTRQLEQQTQIALDITAAFVAINPPTATATLTPYPSETLPPSATPTATLVPPPTDLTGIMVGRSGNNDRMDTAEKMVIFSLTTGDVVPISNLRGQTITTFAGGTQFAFVSEDANDNFSNAVDLVDVEGLEIVSNLTAPETIRAYIESRQPHFSVDGSLMVLVGTQFGEDRDDLFLLTMTGAGGGQIIRQLNTDTANYSYPAISPDGTKIVVVREVLEGDNVGVDLVIIDVASGTPTSLTTDRNATIETMPRWDSASSLVVYSARPEGTQANEIYFIDIRNPDSGQIRINAPDSDEIMPTFSPDGRYLAYSSNRTGDYQIYVQNLSSNEVFQLTFSDDENILGDWR